MVQYHKNLKEFKKNSLILEIKIWKGLDSGSLKKHQGVFTFVALYKRKKVSFYLL